MHASAKESLTSYALSFISMGGEGLTIKNMSKECSRETKKMKMTRPYFLLC